MSFKFPADMLQCSSSVFNDLFNMTTDITDEILKVRSTNDYILTSLPGNNLIY